MLVPPVWHREKHDAVYELEHLARHHGTRGALAAIDRHHFAWGRSKIAEQPAHIETTRRVADQAHAIARLELTPATRLAR